MTAVACAHTGRHEAPERVAAALETLAEAAGHPVSVEVDPALEPTDTSTARFIEAYAKAIKRYDPSGEGCKECTAIYRVALDADALSLARAVRHIVIGYAPKSKKRSPAHFTNGTLVLPLEPGHPIEDAGAPYGVDTVIAAQLRQMFANRGPTDIADRELPRYVLYQGLQLCPITPLTAVYARLKDHELEYARDALASSLGSPGCLGDTRVRASWTTWFRVHAKDLDDNQLRIAARNVFPPAGAPTSAELPGLTPSKYAIAVLKRAEADPTSREARVLLCTGSAPGSARSSAPCSSPLLDYYTLERTGARLRELAHDLVAQHSPQLTTLTCQALFATAGAYQWRAGFLEGLSGDVGVWTAGVTAAFRADASAMNDELVDIWMKHVPLRPALLRAASAAADNEPPRADVVRAITHLAHYICRTVKENDFFTVFVAAVPPSSPLAAEVARSGSSCKAFE